MNKKFQDIKLKRLNNDKTLYSLRVDGKTYGVVLSDAILYNEISWLLSGNATPKVLESMYLEGLGTFKDTEDEVKSKKETLDSVMLATTDNYIKVVLANILSIKLFDGEDRQWEFEKLLKELKSLADDTTEFVEAWGASVDLLYSYTDLLEFHRNYFKAALDYDYLVAQYESLLEKMGVPHDKWYE